MALGLGNAIELSANQIAPGIDPISGGAWGVARETSRGKDTPSGHWELAGLPVDWDWHYFKNQTQSFPPSLIDILCNIAGSDGILGNCFSSGTDIIRTFGEEHCAKGRLICYTSADSVFQIAAHEEHFGRDRLIDVCARFAPEVHRLQVSRVIARPFLGETANTFYRTKTKTNFTIFVDCKLVKTFIHIWP